MEHRERAAGFHRRIPQHSSDDPAELQQRLVITYKLYLVICYIVDYI